MIWKIIDVILLVLLVFMVLDYIFDGIRKDGKWGRWR